MLLCTISKMSPRQLAVIGISVYNLLFSTILPSLPVLRFGRQAFGIKNLYMKKIIKTPKG
jgi:hypothetical protein